MSGTLTQAPTRSTSHGAASVTTTYGDHHIHIPHAPRGTTPNLLRAMAAAIGVMSLIAAVCVSVFASDARSKIAGVGGTDAPSVKATENFVFQVQDMDAQLLNALLAGGDTKVKVLRPDSVQQYNLDRSAADWDLEAATAALAGDQDALNRLHDLADQFGQYQAQAARTLADDQRVGGTAAGRVPDSVVASYMFGHDILFGSDDRSGLVQAAENMEQTSAGAIDDSASAATDSLDTVTAALVLFGLMLLAGLGALQVFVFRHFHRTLNPALVAATLAALVFTIGGAAATVGAGSDFHKAKSDAFDSVLTLSQTKALGSGANADESRWLLAHDHPDLQARFEASYVRGSLQLASAGNATTPLEYDSTIAGVNGRLSAIRARAESRDDRPTGQDLVGSDLSDTGLTTDSAFGREFNNITFDGEADRAFDAFVAYGDYIRDDATLRRMSLSSDQDLLEAVDFDTDAKTPSTSDQAFTYYNAALDKLIQLNQDQFDSAMPAARDGIGTWTWLPYVLALLIVGLTVLGVRPRLSEYR
ncbi:MAG: hypothetical protein HOW97_08185 [Catenulispora sp.]|nr:hypothetical protein [Catenulispora sp.]